MIIKNPFNKTKIIFGNNQISLLSKLIKKKKSVNCMFQKS
jgi:hypothetical protein